LRELNLAALQRKHSAWLKYTQKRSFVRDLLLVNKKYLIIIFTNFNDYRKKLDLYYQIYDQSGKFLSESILLKTCSSYSEDLSFYLKEDTNEYYVLSMQDKLDGMIEGNLFVSRITNQ